MAGPQTRSSLFIPQPTPTVLALILANVAVYVVEIILIRAGFGETLRNYLFLTPAAVLGRGMVWQTVSYGFFHDPVSPMHLLFNMLMLWPFGTQMESWWGRRRILVAYFVFLFSGGLLTVLFGGLCLLPPLSGLLSSFPYVPHLGASGAVLGLMVSWGLVNANRTVEMVFLGRMKGKTVVLIFIGVQLLSALSFSPESATAHFGGIAGAFVLGMGLWKPDGWRKLFKRQGLKQRRALIERELRVLEGGLGKDDDPKKWN